MMTPSDFQREVRIKASRHHSRHLARDAQQGLQVVMLGLVGLSIQAARTESSSMRVIVIIFCQRTILKTVSPASGRCHSRS